jgi:hypothetical protein
MTLASVLSSRRISRLLPGLVPGEVVLIGLAPDVPVSVRMHRPISPPASEGPLYGNQGIGDEATRA